MREKCFQRSFHKLTVLTVRVYRPVLLMVLLSYGPQCTSSAFGQSQSAQDPALNTAKVAAAKKALKEAGELKTQGSPESLTKAIEKYQEALLLFRSLGARPYEAVIHASMGETYIVIGELQKALDSFNQALLLLRAMRDHEHEAVTLNSIGKVYDRLGDIVQALNIQQADANGREIDGVAELAQRLGAGSVMATLWPVADNSTPWLMREFYQTRQTGNGLTKAEAMRRAQLALLNGTAQAEPLPAAQKGASSPVKIVIGANQNKRESANRSGEIVLAITEEVPTFKRDVKTPFAHPYYWAPFILIGNSR